MSLGFLERFMVLPALVEARNNNIAPSALLVFVPEGAAKEGRGVLNQYHFERKPSRLLFQNLKKIKKEPHVLLEYNSFLPPGPLSLGIFPSSSPKWVRGVGMGPELVGAHGHLPR